MNRARSCTERTRGAGALCAPLLVALIVLAPALTEASVPRSSALAFASRDAASLGSLTGALAAPAPAESGFSLFAGDELASADLARGLDVGALELTSHAREEHRHALEGISLIDDEPLRGPPTSEPKTRIGVFEVLGEKLIGVQSGVSLELHWGSGHFGLGIAEGEGKDPIGFPDGPNQFVFGTGNYWKSDPEGLSGEPCPVGTTYDKGAGTCTGPGGVTGPADLSGGVATATSPPDPCNPGPCMRALTPEDRVANGRDALGSRPSELTISSGYPPAPTKEEMKENAAMFFFTLAAAKAGAPQTVRGRNTPSAGPKPPPPPGSTVTWRNGWRTPNGKFATPAGQGRSGEAAEQKVWDAVRAKDGWQVMEGRVYVRDSTGQLRIYDGAAISPRGRVIGLEVKSGSAQKTPEQRSFDTRLNSSPQNQATGVGQSQGVTVQRSVEIRPDE